MLDSFGAKGSEQRLVNSAQAPGGEDGHQQLGGAWHQPCYPVTGLHALGPQDIGKAGRHGLHLPECVEPAIALAVLVDQGDTTLGHMAVTAFDAGIEGCKTAVQAHCGLGMIE
ncbi:hypothetical protein D3C76_1592580 [compost metagenome]